MHRPHATIRGVISVFVLVTLIISAACIFGTYRARAANASAQFSPVEAKLVRLAAGTVIEAELRSPIPESSQIGDTLTAFVSRPVILNAALMIPAGARLKGVIQSVNVVGRSAKAQIKFTQLSLNHHSSTIDTGQTLVRVPVQSDFEILSDAWITLMSTGFGAALGASTGDVRLIDSSLRTGVVASAAAQIRIPIEVILGEDLEVR